MVILTKKESDKCRFVTFGRIKSLKTITLKDGRRSSEIEFLHLQGETELTDKVRFVNSKNGDFLLSDKISRVPLGTEILLSISKFNNCFYATNFAEKNGCLKIDDDVIFYSEAHKLPDSIGVETIMGGKSKLHEIEGLSLEKDKESLIIVAKHNEKIRMSKRGEEIFMYDGIKTLTPVSPEMKQDILITIGCYQNRPISSSVLLNRLMTSEGDDLKKLVAWVSYVVDDWSPALEDVDCWTQKNEIARIFGQFNNKN